MKIYLIPFLASLALPHNAYSNIDPRINEKCLGSAHYESCVELNIEIANLPRCNSSSTYNCTGELRYTNAYYVGEISNGKEHGFGTINWDSRDKYVGQWINGKREGQGTYYWAGGNKYVGQWLNDKREGQGTYYWSNGDKYVGQFKNSKKHGQGTYFYSRGGSWSGEWRWGEKTENGSYDKTNEEDAFYYKYLR